MNDEWSNLSAEELQETEEFRCLLDDAKRYRWLRKKCPEILTGVAYHVRAQDRYGENGVDNVIDDAIEDTVRTTNDISREIGDLVDKLVSYRR